MSKRHIKKALYVLAGALYALLVLLVISIALIPTATTIVFKHWLAQQQLQGDIGHIGLALNSGTLTILDAKISDKQAPLLKLDKLQIQLRLRDLLNHKLTIERVELIGTRLQLQQRADALVVAGVRLNQTGAEAPPAATRPQPAGTPWTIQLNSLHVANLDTCLATTGRQSLEVCNHLGDFSWQGKVRLTTSDPLKLNCAGNLFIKKLDIEDAKRNASLLQVNALALANIHFTDLDLIQFDKFELQQLEMLPNQGATAKNTPTLAINDLLVNAVSINRMADIDIADIRIDDISSYIKLKADNSIAALGELPAYRPIESEKKVAATPTAANPFHIKIGKIAVTTTKSLILEDAHTKPSTVHSIDNFSFTLGAIDSSKPAQASAVTMQFKYGKYGQAKVTGTVEPFASKPTMNLAASIVGLNLNKVSPYTRELLQHKIKSGQLDAQLTVKIEQGTLESKAKLTLQKFYVTKLSAQEADKYQQSLGIPLSAALSLLRDKNDAINIELPVTGDIEKPDFSLNDIIATVSAKAIKVAIVNYYATLGLLKLVSGAIDLATALRFDPLEFMPGQTDLTDKSRAALDKFATMLQDRPQVHLVVCGHATLADQRNLFPPKNKSTDTTAASADAKPAPLTEQQLQQLNKLALERGEQVKQYLVERKGVGADRLIQCNPEYDANDGHSPYVELHI